MNAFRLEVRQRRQVKVLIWLGSTHVLAWHGAGLPASALQGFPGAANASSDNQPEMLIMRLIIVATHCRASRSIWCRIRLHHLCLGMHDSDPVLAMHCAVWCIYRPYIVPAAVMNHSIMFLVRALFWAQAEQLCCQRGCAPCSKRVGLYFSI